MKKLTIVCAILGLLFLALASLGETVMPPPPPPATLTAAPTLEPKKTPDLVKPKLYRVLVFPVYKNYAIP